MNLNQLPIGLLALLLGGCPVGVPRPTTPTATAPLVTVDVTTVATAGETSVPLQRGCSPVWSTVINRPAHWASIAALNNRAMLIVDNDKTFLDTNAQAAINWTNTGTQVPGAAVINGSFATVSVDDRETIALTIEGQPRGIALPFDARTVPGQANTRIETPIETHSGNNEVLASVRGGDGVVRLWRFTTNTAERIAFSNPSTQGVSIATGPAGTALAWMNGDDLQLALMDEQRRIGPAQTIAQGRQRNRIGGISSAWLGDRYLVAGTTTIIHTGGRAQQPWFMILRRGVEREPVTGVDLRGAATLVGSDNGSVVSLWTQLRTFPPSEEEPRMMISILGSSSLAYTGQSTELFHGNNAGIMAYTMSSDKLWVVWRQAPEEVHVGAFRCVL